MNDPVNHPEHYTGEGIECIDYMEQVLTAEEFGGYLRGCMIKYQHRLLRKGNPVQDAEKMQWYGAKLVEHMKRNLLC